jgi:hypothetical protein
MVGSSEPGYGPWWEAGVGRLAMEGGADVASVPGRDPERSLRSPGGFSKEILRKEVIQPQVPLRLPCYDLVPITGFTFGACR